VARRSDLTAMRIFVVGPGALGLLFAALLGRAGHEIWLLDHNSERAAFLAARGIWLEENDRAMRISVRAAVRAPVSAAADLVLLCVKSQAVTAALEQIVPLLAPSSLLIAFQNGISHLEVCRRRLSAGEWAAGITVQGATLLARGRVRHGGWGPTHLGFLDPVAAGPRLLCIRAAAVFREAGMAAEMEENMLATIWRKLLVNVGINALTALHDCANGRLLELPELREHLAGAVLEAAAVARARGLDVGDDPVADVLAVCAATKNNISSMLQDMRLRRATEIDAINGALVAEAHRAGVAAPVNEELVRAVKSRELQYL
jgi:2-dehydropantoate 2-reductase